jgi:hypothetical protein
MLPVEALSCCDLNCVNICHNRAVSKYCEGIYACCLKAGSATIPLSGQSKNINGGGIAGRNEYVRPYRDKSLFWHKIWKEAGSPRNGALADIMRSIRFKYHSSIRESRKNEECLRKQAFAESVLANKTRDFWKEVNKMRRKHTKFPSVVDAQTDNNDISQVFASNYADLYNSVPCDKSDLDDISNHILYQIAYDIHTYDHIVHFNEVIDAIII